MKKIIYITSIFFSLLLSLHILKPNIKVYSQTLEYATVFTDENGIKYGKTSDNQLVVLGYSGTLTDLAIPQGVVSIENEAFSNCENLISIEISDSVQNIGDSAFYFCSKLKSVKMSNNLKNIGDSAFSGCAELESIEIPNSVVEIGNLAFSDCNNLINIEIPNNVENIGESAFSNCIKLTNIKVSDDNLCYKSIDGILYTKDVKVLMQYPPAKDIDEFEIPDDVITIKDNAFSRCWRLEKIYIPNSVTNIEESSFSRCTGLKAINIAFDNLYYKSIDGNLYSKDGKTLIQYLSGKRENYFEIPDTVTKIGYKSFGLCIWLEEVKIPNSVTNIESNAFYGCTSLTSIKIPNSVTSIGEYTFFSCIDLTSIEIPNSVTSIGSYAFSRCTRLTNVEIPNSVTSIGSYAFYYCDSLTNIEIPNSVTSIGGSAFSHCTSLTNIEIPNSVTIIESFTFDFCESLQSVKIPNSVTSIGIMAFWNCKNLISVKIPSNVENIEWKAFDGCDRLTIYCETTECRTGWDKEWNGGENKRPVYYGINEDNFVEVNNLQYALNLDNQTAILSRYTGSSDLVQIPKTITHNDVEYNIINIGNYAFSFCENLNSIIFLNDEISVGNGSFDSCKKLEKVTFAKQFIQLHENSFSNCDFNLIKFYILAEDIDLSLLPNTLFYINEHLYDEYKENYSELNIISYKFNTPIIELDQYISSGIISAQDGDYTIDKIVLNDIEIDNNTVLDENYTDGVYELIITDIVGLQTKINFIIDKTKPVIDNIINDKYYNSDQMLSFSDLNFACATLNGENITNNYLLSVDGEFELKVVDKAGNETIVNFIIDKTAPFIFYKIDGKEIEKLVDNTFISNQKVFLEINEIRIKEILLDNISYNKDILSQGIMLNEGYHSIKVTDEVDNETVINFAVDVTKPNVINSFTMEGLETKVYNEILTICFDDNADYYLGGTTPGSCISSISLVFLDKDENDPQRVIEITDFTKELILKESGRYLLNVTDLAGNFSTINFSIASKPTIEINNLGVDSYNNTYQGVIINVKSYIGLKNITINGEHFVNGSTINVEGVYTIIATDNRDEVSTLTFIIDKTTPKITGYQEGVIYQNIDLNIEDSNLYSIKINNVEFPLDNRISLTESGTYNIEVLDKAFNKTSITITIDNIKPILNYTKDKKGNYIINGYSEDCNVSILKDDKLYELNDDCIIKENGKYSVTICDVAGNINQYDFVIGKNINYVFIIIINVIILSSLPIIFFIKKK